MDSTNKKYWQVTIMFKNNPSDTKEVYVFAQDERAAKILGMQAAISKFRDYKMHEMQVLYVDEEEWEEDYTEQITDSENETDPYFIDDDEESLIDED